MKCIRGTSVLVTTVVSLAVALIACSGGSDDSGSASQASIGGFGGGGFDPLFMGADGGAAGTCATCIEGSCSTQLAALEAELKAIHTATAAAFTCVEKAGCLANFWNSHDAGAKAAVSACIAACEVDAGVPDRDAAESDLMGLAQALETCVDTSCATACPGADHDAGGVKITGPVHDASADANAAPGNGTGIGGSSSGGSTTSGRDCGTDSDSGDGRHRFF